MDPITLAIVGALAKLSEIVIKDGYDALKSALSKKFGAASDLSKAIENVEKKPNSRGRKETLQEEVSVLKADKDPELVKLAEALLNKIQDLPGGKNIVSQTVTGNQNIFSGTGNVSVNDGPKNKPRKK